MFGGAKSGHRKEDIYEENVVKRINDAEERIHKQETW